MKNVLSILFGARSQVVVGVVFLILTVVQSWYWGIHSKPSTMAVFWVSMEALALASYAIIATGLGYRATERVETAMINSSSIDTDE